MSKPLIFMFSGQGSHYYQMGRHLYEQNTVFRNYLEDADMLAQKELGASILVNIYADGKKRGDIFDNIHWSHPALFMVQYAFAQTLIAAGIYPAKVLGASLGELVAAAIAGVISWEEGVLISIRQAQYLSQYCPSGGMLAILYESSLYYEQPLLHRNLALAAENFSKHFIVAGSQQAIYRAVDWLKQQDINIHPLAVSQGFHSDLIDNAQEAIIRYQTKFEYKPIKIPFISCATANEISNLNAMHIWQAIRAPILFRQTIQNLEQLSCYRYLDIGPSGTLATFVKYNLLSSSRSEVITSSSPYVQEQDIITKLKHDLTGSL